MARDFSIWAFLRSLVVLVLDVLAYWQARFLQYWNRKPQQAALVRTLQDAKVYEEWEAAGRLVDELRANDLWRQSPISRYYDYRLINERLQAILQAREDDDTLGLVNILRSGLVRNIGNITAPQLFNRAYAGTKLLIEEYITQVVLAIDYVASYPTEASTALAGLTSQAKLDVLHDTRQAFGRSALVLQGGAVFGLCHIGVVKALHSRGLLPRIIAGLGTGALIAALVGVHTEDELLEFPNNESIDLGAFGVADEGKDADRARAAGGFGASLWQVVRLIREGYLLDIQVLEQSVRANVGDLTFEEAYARTKRILNIMVPAEKGSDIPGLLNYLTAPHVLIRSAAIASNVGNVLPSSINLLCKDVEGRIYPWSSHDSESSKSQTYSAKAGPRPSSSSSITTLLEQSLARMSELFNVNHLVISRARPSAAPFLQTSSDSMPRANTANARRRNFLWHPIQRLIVLECQHRLQQLLAWGILSHNMGRHVLDTPVPGASLTIVPELTASDFTGLLGRPTKEDIDTWIRRGERSVWPAINALRVRCAIEFALDRAYQLVRRRKPMDFMGFGDVDTGQGEEQMREPAKRRRRQRDRREGEHDAAASGKLL